MIEQTITTLRERRLEPEIMDQPGLAIADHRHALTGLATMNRLSLTSQILSDGILSLARHSQGQPLRVLDLACGGGDVLIALAQRARALRIPLVVVGCDISPFAVTLARERAVAAETTIEFLIQDVVNEPLLTGFDVVMSSLFLHHLSSDAAIALLRRMRIAARRRVLVNDLLRSWRGYVLAKFACNVFSRSYIVRTDGPASVKAAFSLPEVRSMAQAAGLDGARFSRRWPQRFLLAWDQR
jgi:SAM-dependent methyltransferase